VCPPFVINEAQLKEGLAIIDEAINIIDDAIKPKQ